MPKSITSILNQPIRYGEPSEGDCQCTEQEQCLLVASNQRVYSQLKILPCGDFAVCNNSLDAESVCNGEFDLGAELVTNGTFTGSATGWTLGTNWAYETNDVRATAAAAGQTLSQTIASLAVGSFYYVSYTISSYSAGDVRVTLGGTNGTTRNANGTYTELIQVAAGTTLSFERVTTNFSGDIDDVSVKLLDCWTIGAGWAWVNGVMTATAANTAITQTIGSLVTGNKYLVIYTVSNYTGGDIDIRLGGTAGATRTANGTYSEVLICGATTTLLLGAVGPNFSGSIDDVSVMEINTCWDADEADWITTALGACHETGNTTDLTNTGTPVVSGKYYHITINVTESTAGGINIVLGTTVLTPQTSGNGVFHFWGTSNGTTLIVRPTSTFDGCISALTADEYCTDYEFNILDEDGNFILDITADYILTEDVYNLVDFFFNDDNDRIPFGCYKFCLVDCCADQQTATSLLLNYDFSQGSLYWSSRNTSFSGGAATLFPELELSAFIEQALITTGLARCINITFDFANEAIFSQTINIYINGALVDSESLLPGAGAYTNTFENVPAGAVIRFEHGSTENPQPIILDNIIVIVEEGCLPIYDQCTPCITFQGSFNCTKLIDAYCDGNAYGFAFDDSSGNNQFKLSLRVVASLIHSHYEQEQEDYDSSDGNTSLSFGQNKKFQSVAFDPIPEYKHDTIALQKICDTFQIDTVDYFVKKGDYTPEWNRNDLTDLAPSRIDVKKKDQTLFNTNCE